MKVILVGNMGYVGPVVAAHLRAQMPDAELIGIDSAWFANCLTTSGTFPERVLNEQRFADARDISAEDFRGADAVVQLAAVSNDPMGNRYEAVTDQINHGACVIGAKAAAEAGVKRFVFASSCSVYGFADGNKARTEQDEINPLTAYARSKIASEDALEKLSDSGMTISCLRFATACGGSPRIRLDLVLNDFVAGALSSKRIEVLSDGTPWRPLIDVKDMARAIEWGIQRDAANGGKFLRINVGNDERNHQVADLANAVGEFLPGTQVTINTEAPPDKRSYKVDFGLYRTLAPEHQPQQTLEASIKDIRAVLEDIGFQDQSFRQSNFMRLKVLEGHIQSGRLQQDSLRWV